MADNINSTEQVEAQMMAILTNEPSEPIKLENFDTYVVFQRPPFKEKYKGRAWSSRKLKEMGYENPIEEDPDIAHFFRYWGTLNTYVTRILVPDDKGKVKLDNKKYTDYEYDPKTDLDYSSLLEKYVIEELYPRGISEEMFLSDVIVEHANWLETTSVEEADLKNS